MLSLYSNPKIIQVMKKYIKIVVAFSLALLINNSCTKDFDQMNTKRDLVIRELVDVNMMFTKVLVDAVVNAESGFGGTGNWAGMSVSGASNPFITGENNGVWDATYGNSGRNLSDIIDICATRSNSAELVNKRAIARILKVWAFARCTDTYGDIPYFESCLPVEKAVITPKYDLQKDIYIDFFKELKEAVAEFDASKPSYGNADILYKGDIDKWKKFANSLRLRLALRVRYADPAMASAQMADLTEADLITSRDDDAFIANITDYPDHQNSRYTDLVARKATVIKADVAKTFLDILLDNNDPRLHVFADTVTALFPDIPDYVYHKFRGRPLLSGESQQESYAYGNSTVCKWSDLFWVQIQKFPLYKASETYFNLAEAALFDLKSGDAQAYYKTGVELAMADTKQLYDDAVPQLQSVVTLFNAGKTQDVIDAALANVIAQKEITQAQIDDFVNNAPVMTLAGSDENMLEQIINQKIIALFPQEHEGWCEQRRTGYPRILVGVDNSPLQGHMPRRMPWPGSEQLVNSAQYKLALARIGGEGKDERTTNIWWEANPDPYKPHPGTVETRNAPWGSQ
jgi:hypothetical protein